MNSRPLAVLIISVIAIALFVFVIRAIFPSAKLDPVERAGRRGEKEAAQIIKSVLQKDDVLLNNVEVSYGDKETEIDSLVINRNGVFIIEVKNYVGELEGEEDDYEWTKYKETYPGQVYTKQVRNPIPQVKRQIYILAKYLEYSGQDVWVEGYCYLINNNSPVKSSYMLESVKDIDRAIHSRGKNRLSKADIEFIVKALEMEN